MPGDRSRGTTRSSLVLPRALPTTLRYGATVVAVGISILISVWLRPFSQSTPFLFFYPAVIFSAWIGGLRPGLLATGLCSIAANYFLLGPHDGFSFETPNLIRTLLFGAGFAGICWLAELARNQLRSVINVQSKLLDLASDPIIVRDAENRVIYWNHGAERLYGWTNDDAYGQITHSLLKTRFPKPLAEILSDLKRTGRWHGELNHTKKDGSTVVVASTWTIQSGSDNEAAVLEANYDLTDRKHAERALRESEETLRTIFNGVYDGIVLHSPTGSIIDVNDRFLVLYGIRREDIARLTIADISSPSSPIDSLPSLWAKVIAGESQFFEWKALRPHDRSEFDVEVFLQRLRLGSERDAVLANVRDITDRKRIEDEKRILQMKLAQAQKMEAIGRMAGGVAHDFNNLLNVISGYSELALVSDPAQAMQSVGQIQRATGTAAALTRQLLTFSNTNVLQPRTIDLCEVIRETVSMLPRLLGEDIQVRTDLGSVCAAKMAPGQLEQIIINLAVNARDAMPQGGVLSFRTSTTRIDKGKGSVLEGLSPGSYVTVSVSDTGEGIAEDILPRLFEPFFTTKEPGKGTGLGLATVRGIANQNGGRVFVESVLGRGTTFTLYLPAVASAEAARVPTDTAVRTDLKRGSETILLVEDSAALCELTKVFLEMQGYTVHAAPNGVEALEIIEKLASQIDLLFTDVVMPLMSGPHLAKKARQFQPHLSVLYASGYVGELLEQHGVRREDIQIIEKPYSFETLSIRVREILDSRPEQKKSA
jgi:two-component system, cell cycle sensor histidine kinase and response regulator CckA